MKNIWEKLRCWGVILAPALLLCGVYFANENDSPVSQTFVQDDFSIPDWEVEEEISRESLLQEIAAYEDSLTLLSPRIGQEVKVEGASVSPVATQDIPQPATETDASSIPNVTPPPALTSQPTANIWQISTTRMSMMNPVETQMSRLSVHQWEGRQWSTRSLEDFYAMQQPGEPVLFFIHGNRVSPDEALAEGVRLLRCFPAHPQIRLVIWHWRADRVSRRPRPEYSTKAVYADYQGYYLACVLRGMREDAPILLAGHSFGARTVLSGLHFLGGGGYGGRFLNAYPEEYALEIQAFMIAAATNRTDFVSNGLFHLAPQMAQKISITQNPCDPALKFYPKMNAGTRLPEAMGYAGPAVQGVTPENVRKLQILSVAIPSHSLEYYLQQPNIRAALYHAPL